MANRLQLTLTFTEFAEILQCCMDHPEIPELQRFEALLQAKLDKMIDHDLYTTYRSAATDEQRQQARREYLDRKGIPDAFRW